MKKKTLINALTFSYDGSISNDIIINLKNELEAEADNDSEDSVAFIDSVEKQHGELKIFHEVHLRKKLSNIDKSLGEINSTLATIKNIIVFLLILFIIGIIISALSN